MGDVGLSFFAYTHTHIPSERTLFLFFIHLLVNMPKYYCDYCDTYLTHDSPSVRKTHCQGRKHKENVRDYYQKWMEEQAQKLVCFVFNFIEFDFFVLFL